jgi:hypothetical protein
MSLALVGFTLQSFPLENSIAFSSSAIPLSYLPIRTCQLLPINLLGIDILEKVLIRFQVRSHPALVLPAAGGRFSLGFVVPFREFTNRSWLIKPSSHVLQLQPRRNETCTSEY